jgi:hypothetical protein
MAPMRLLTFKQALDKASGYSKRHLVLGNGFSIACAPKIFTYGSLFERAKPDMSDELLKVFERLNTTDFEEVIPALRRASAIIPIYKDLPKTAARMLADAESLKQTLVKAVAGQHPARPNLIPDSRYAACRTFLAKFIGEAAGGKVYTLNYDLLLYWALMHEPDEPDGLGLDHDDGADRSGVTAIRVARCRRHRVRRCRITGTGRHRLAADRVPSCGRSAPAYVAPARHPGPHAAGRLRRHDAAMEGVLSPESAG